MKRVLLQLLVFILVTAPVGVLGSSDNNGQKMTDVSASHNIPYGVIEKRLIPYTYSGGERFRYDISYTGGLKLGELHLELVKSDDGQGDDRYVIFSRATTQNGFFSKLYPIEDLHVTKVFGPERLPYHYEVWQKEGYSYEAHRVYQYDQDNKKISYQHNDNPVVTYELSDTTQNEFSSFFASRLMDFTPGTSFIVPTFADKKRIEVVVMVKGNETLEETVFGTVETTIVEPIMTFRGLYDKNGDTVIWYTADECRVPVLINSKIVIGSLTATLVAYENASCPQYDRLALPGYDLDRKRSKQTAKN